jgi:hypothetical protein
MPTPQTIGNVETVRGLQNLSFAEAAIKASFDTGEAVPVTAFKSISWKATVTVGKGYGPGGRPTRRSSGQVTYANSVILYPDGMVRLNQRLAAIAAEKGLIRDGDIHQVGLVVWDLHLGFRYAGADVARLIVFHQCRIVDTDETAAEGEALLENNHTLDIMDQWEVDPEDPNIKWALR